MNKVILVGRLTKDPEISYGGANNTAVARYTLAVDRPFKSDETDYISCVAFAGNAEFTEKYLKKGTKIIAEGRIQTGSYTNKEGKKVYTTEVVVERHEFCESKKPAENTADPEWMNVPEDEEDLPFN